MEIEISGLPPGTTADELRNAFGEYGKIGAVTLTADKASGGGALTGFVEMPLRDEGLSAVKALGGKPFGGRAVRVAETTRRREKEMIG